MDAQNIPGFRPELHEGRIERPIGRSVFFWFGVSMSVLTALILGRLIDLEAVRGRALLAQSAANRSYPVLIEAPRGVIYDRNRTPLVANTPIFAVSLRPSGLTEASFSRSLDALARLFSKSGVEIAQANGVDADPSVRSELGRWPREIYIASGDIRDQVLEIESRPDDFPGVVVSEVSKRFYLLGPAASHLIGYVSRPDAKDLAAYPELHPTDVVGRAGLESFYEQELRGRAGEKLTEVNASGAPLRERFIQKPEPGSDVLLEIDANVQAVAAATLQRHLKALGKKAGAVVVLDPSSGAVRALASYPSFDPNLFGRSAAPRDVERVLADPGHPFFNRAISGAYPSASTIKPLLASAALEEHIIDPHRIIYDPGYLSVPNPYDPSRPNVFKDWKELGEVDMRRAIALSANVYFYTVGGGYGDIHGLGITRIGEYLKRFGWGAPTGIDLPGEAAGLIPSPGLKPKIRPRDPVWRLGDTYLTSIGQGDLQITPLQLAAATAAIANGGTLWQPHILAALLGPDGEVERRVRPHAIRDGFIRPEHLQIVREGMRRAVTEGSAQGLAELGVAVAGKTGTAQTGVYGKNHGWFVGFAPYDRPELVIAVLVEEGTGGSTDAVPIAREILDSYFARTPYAPLTATPPPL